MRTFEKKLNAKFKRVVRGLMSKDEIITFANGYISALVDHCILDEDEARQYSAAFNAQVVEFRHIDTPAYDPDEPQE